MYIGILDRFGSELSCVSKTKKGVVDSIMHEYEETYKKCNDGLDPRLVFSYGDQSDYDIAERDIMISKYVMDKVQWR